MFTEHYTQTLMSALSSQRLTKLSPKLTTYEDTKQDSIQEN